ncbi:NlpC/P60 family protein [Henriciella litoralis]|uniref:NlpC/P60 family protein n=1 Tax=Henriciella litoralis TaxID=568102 RepID=UPI000A035BA6|nr:NlpC/P60 family protein [Henriciella litoralis]
MKRADIIAAAEGWLGTPYQHQASRKGAGTDCLGLLRGIWRELVGAEPQETPPYTPDWADVSAQDTLLDVARRHLVEVPIGEARAGDVLLFRMGLGCAAKHCAVLTGPGQIIHAYWGRNVCTTRLVPWWERRIAGAFSFPGLED